MQFISVSMIFQYEFAIAAALNISSNPSFASNFPIDSVFCDQEEV